jgi:hypothetical protein
MINGFISSRDRSILRDLARRKLEIAHDPVNAERRNAWYALDAGEGDRTMILAEICGIWDTIASTMELKCAPGPARSLEQMLLTEIYQFEVLKDDHVVEPFTWCNWQVDAGTYGVAEVVHQPDNDGRLGARNWDPPIKDLDRDFDLLKPRVFNVNRKTSLAEKAKIEELFDGILEVKWRGSFYWTLGMTWMVIRLIGLEQFMLAMYDNPQGLHRLMTFLCEDHLALVDWLEREHLYSLNNLCDYIGSGSVGYTQALPRPGRNTGAGVRTEDQWVLLESQETVGVGPDLFAEFIYPYQRRIAARFGRIYYGCCEPVHTRWRILNEMPGLARVSVSPWCDQDYMAGALGRTVVFSRKPNPTLVSTARFDEDAIRYDLRTTCAAARKCRLEIIMKDVHTVHDDATRLPRWVALAREMSDR